MYAPGHRTAWAKSPWRGARCSNGASDFAHPTALRSLLPNRIASIPHVFHQPLRTDLGADNIAHGVGRHALSGAGAGRLLHRIRNEGGDRSIACLADANAALPAVVILGNGFGFGIGDIDHIVLVDIDAARPAELRPLVEILP